MITSLITASNEELSDKIDECLKDESNVSTYEAGSYYLLKIIVYQNEFEVLQSYGIQAHSGSRMD